MSILFWIFAVCLGYVLLLGYGDLIRLALSLLRLAGYADKMSPPEQSRTAHEETLAPVTVVLPKCENVRDAAAYVEHHLKFDYPQYEVVAVCDGARSDTLDKLQKAFRLVKIDQPIKRSVPTAEVRGVYRSPDYPDLVVVDKAPAGHADDLNCGVNVSRYPVVITASPGRWLKGDGLWPLARPIMVQFSILAVGGLPRLAPGFGGVASQLQATWLSKEYPAGIAVPGQKRLPLVPEGYGAFRKTAVVAAGGFAKNTAELDMSVHLFVNQKKEAAGVQMLPRAAWQIMPWQGFSGLWGSYRSIQKEMQSALWNCRGMAFRPRYGRTGMWDVPLHMVTDVAGPILEVLGIVLSLVLFAAGAISGTLFWGFWIAQVLFGMLDCLAAVLSQQVEENDNFTMQRLLKNVGCAILYPIGFRQLVAVMRTAAIFAPKER